MAPVLHRPKRCRRDDALGFVVVERGGCSGNKRRHYDTPETHNVAGLGEFLSWRDCRLTFELGTVRQPTLPFSARFCGLADESCCVAGTI
jgi:hypothetical protein